MSTYCEKTKALVLEIGDNYAVEKLEKYVELIEQHNQVMNLTGFHGDDLWKNGIYEAIFLLSEYFKSDNNLSVLDIGAGVGFPSIPLKIIFPNINLTILEPIQKRLKFLEIVATELALDINLVCGRAETNKSAKFDLILARAVAPLRILLEISTHLGKIGAKYIFLKGKMINQEIVESKKILDVLKISEYQIVTKQFDQQHTHYLFIYSKNQPTPQGFPRTWIKIKNG